MGPGNTADNKNKPVELGLYFQPRGGCNEEDVGSNCGQLTYGWQSDSGLHGETILVGLGAHPVRRAPDGSGPMQQAPDILDLLNPKSPQKLRAIFLPHAHGDDDDGIMRYLEHGYRLPPIFADELTINILKEKLSGRIHKGGWPMLVIVRPGEPVTIGPFTLEAVQMGHTLSSSGAIIKAGGVATFFTGDFKLDQTTLTPKTDLNRLARMGENQEIDALFLDSTRADKPGSPTPEADIRANLKAITDKHPHKRINIVVETGNAEALARAGWVAAQDSRVYVHHGSSIEHRLRAMNRSGMDLQTLTGHDALIVASGPTKLAGKLNPSYVLNVMAGVNGEKSSVLNRVSRGEYEHFKAGPDDVFIFSSSVKPWNAVKLEENIRLLQSLGVEHIYRDGPNQPALDATGHEHGEGIKQLAALVQPKSAVIGVHGSAGQRDACRQLFNQIGEKPVPMVVDNGTILRINSVDAALTGHEDRSLVNIPVRPHPSTLANAPAGKAELKVA